MRICYINPTNNIRRPVVDLSRILADRGHKITVIFPHNIRCNTADFHFINQLEHENITVIPIDSYYYTKLRYSIPKPLDLILKLRKALRNNDIVHIWEYYYPISIYPIFSSIFTRNRRKIILTTDGFVGYSYKPINPKWLVPAFKLYTNIIARFIFKLAPTITTYGNAMITYARQASVPLNKLKILPTGINPDKFQNAKQGLIRSEFNLQNSFTILFVGMLTERKNVDIVIKVSLILLDRGIDIKTLIVGEGSEELEFRKLVPDRYKEKIIFTGGRKDVANFYKDANVLLLPSMGEGLPGVVMESMVASLPVVATNEGCTPDLILDHKSGFLVNPYDIDGYSKAVMKFIDNPELANTIAVNARRSIEEYNWEKVIKLYLNLYRQIQVNS